MPNRTTMISIGTTILITVIITFVLMALSAVSGGYATPQSAQLSERLTIPIIIHLATVVPALLLGPFILWREKGDGTHRLLGRIWAGLLLVTAIASVFIRAPGGGIAGTGFSAIHMFTVWTFINIPLAVWMARKGDIATHRAMMTGLYVGLCVAGAFTLIPGRILGNLVFG